MKMLKSRVGLHAFRPTCTPWYTVLCFNGGRTEPQSICIENILWGRIVLVLDELAS